MNMFFRAPKEPLITRESFLKISGMERSVLEIGPFNNPTVRGSNVIYFDVMTTEQLRARAKRVDYDPETVPDISYVSHDGNLNVINRTFSAVVSCHCIEHQPDLIRHFKQVEALLDPKGKYYLIIPDKRYCFDHFIDESSFQAVLSAKGETRHPLAKVVEHRALTTHNNPWRHWAGDHMDDDYIDTIPSRSKKAIDEFKKAKGGYVDVHRWQFTPDSFKDIVTSLHQRQDIGLKLAEINKTPPGDMQFTAIMERR